MNKGLLLGFFDSITDFFLGAFNLIPQLVYFLFTAFSSAIDAMQALIRKLAGLDTYYRLDVQTNKYETFAQTDPLTEFIYGILGFGNSSATYAALNTVFWSLSIFGLIMLVVSTMVAMIKSHYSEDYAGTNPWKYIYTAIKAVLTYAVLPVIMIVGLQLSSFILRTLDNITAGTGSTEQIKGVYGTDAEEIFEGSTMSNGKKSYIHYDFFGYGEPTNNTPFGSMLFKAAAYSCNRARTGDVPVTAYQQITSSGKQIFGSQACQEFSALTSNNEKREYVATQIDYAFCNNLQLQSSISVSTLDSVTDEYMSYSSAFDLFGSGTVDSFTKYNVSAIWFFYNLWKFNFIVGFGGGIVIFGILISIIVGLMTRLVKGAALFLIYPSLLGIAPLDSFKAFKGWGTNILQQIMMAFGAIIGMNILMLILPYVQSISFFGIGLLDAIVSMILLVVGLLMAKDFISMVSGFVGGGDANTIGAGMKSEVGATIKKGASMTGKLAGGTARVLGRTAWGAGAVAVKTTYGVTKGVVKGGIKVGKAISHKVKASAIDKKNKMGMESNFYEHGMRAGGLQRTIEDTVKAAKGKKGGASVDNDAVGIAQAAMQKAKAMGKSERAQEAAARKAIEEKMKNTKDPTTGKTQYALLKKQEQEILASQSPAFAKQYKKYQKAKHWEDQALNGDLKLKQKKGGNYSTSGFIKNTGKAIGGTIAGIGSFIGKDIFGSFGKAVGKEAPGWGKTFANSFMKSLGTMNEAVGLDKVFAGMKDIAKQSLTMAGGPFENKKAEGDKLQSKIAEQQSKDSAKQTEILKTIASEMSNLKLAQKEGNKIQDRIYRATSQQAGSGKNSGGSSGGSTK